MKKTIMTSLLSLTFAVAGCCVPCPTGRQVEPYFDSSRIGCEVFGNYFDDSRCTQDVFGCYYDKPGYPADLSVR